MPHTTWMIYGAAGATGTLIAEEAIHRGHQPLLAGRSAETLASLGKRLGLPWMAVGLDEPGRLERAVSDVDAVLNAAGPFIATAPPLVQACLAAGTHYLDIAGEIPALQHLFARDQAARERNITLIGGVGFGVVASNGLVKYVADQLPGATTLELALKADNQQTSQGATKSVLEVLAGGGRVYRDGHLVPFRLGKGLKALRFPDGTFDILPVPSGDLEAAYRATGIANITAFMPFRRSAAFLLPLVQWGLSLRPIRGRLEAAVEKRGTRQRESQAGGQRTSYAWARAMNQNGQQVEARLALGEGYHFTAGSLVQAVEHVLRDHPSGATFPSPGLRRRFCPDYRGGTAMARSSSRAYLTGEQTMKKLEVSTNNLHPSRRRSDMTSPRSISRLESIRLGGTEQWIRIRGKDTSNPVLLLIQQGPGLPMLNEAADDNKQWHLEDDFVVVYWDQRACGKSFSRAIPPQSMTVEQLITDTHELIQALTQRFNVAHLYVAGFSLGGTIAALVASRHPEHIREVVCVDLDVQFDVAERVAYDFALQQATRLGHKRAIQELRRIGLPPHLESKTFSTRVKWVTNFGGVNRQETYPRLSLKTLRQLVLSRDYTLSDIVGTLRGMRFAQDQLLPDLANAQRQAAHLVRRVRAHAPVRRTRQIPGDLAHNQAPLRRGQCATGTMLVNELERQRRKLMRIHAIQTGTVAIKQRQVHGAGQGIERRLNTVLDHAWTDPLPIYVWVIEHPEGIIVVDTGETARATEPGYFPWWHPYYRLGVREWVRPEEEVGPQLRALGIPPEEVRWVVLTHLHSDHAGGLAHFPKADILLSRTEYQSASGWRGQVRGYLPHHWPAWFAPTLIPFAPAAVGPFPRSYPLTRAQDVLLVPTEGHTPGHLSVIVLEDDHALLLTGDTSYSQLLMLDEAVDGVAPDEQASRQTLRRIHAYTQQVPTVYLPSHDPEARERLFHRQTVLFPETIKAVL